MDETTLASSDVGPAAAYARAADVAAAVALDDLADAALDAELIALVRARHRLDAEIARRLERWDRSSVWSGDGSRSPSARLARDGRLSPREAGRTVRRARRCAAMPRTVEAWRRGEVGTDLVDLLGLAAAGGRRALFARDEALLLGECEGRSFAQAGKLVAYWRHRADAELRPDGAPPPPPTHMQIGTTFDGAVTGDFTLDPIGGAAVTEALRRIERDLYRADQRAGRHRTRPERLAAALVEMAHRAMTSPADGRRPVPLVTILAGEATVEHLCELADGSVVAPGVVVPHLGAADVQTFIFDGADRVVAASPVRTFRGMVRRAVQVRDRHCQHPSGCDVPIVGCDVDHVVPVARGGCTEEANGRLQCEAHNRRSDLHGRCPADVVAAARERRQLEAAVRARVQALVAARRAGPGERPPPVQEGVCMVMHVSA